MKNVLLLLLLLLTNNHLLRSQINCIHCFEQNGPVNTGVTNLIVNGGFENTNCTPGWFQDVFCPNSLLYNCDLADWTCTGGDDLSYPSVFDSTKSTIPEGLNAAYFGNGNAFACSEQWGDSSCYSITSCAVTGIPKGYPRSNPGYGDETGVSLEQTVSGLTIGQTYVLEFWAGGEPLSGLLTSSAVFAVDVGFGKTYLTCKPTGEPGQLIGTRYSIVFDANATSHRIKFTNWGHTCDICTELVVDDVSLYTIEELPGSVPACNTAIDDVADLAQVSIFPNPFHSSVNFDFTLLTPQHIHLTIYDATGLHVETLIHNALPGGEHHVEWNAFPDVQGLYFYKMTGTEGYGRTGKLIRM